MRSTLLFVVVLAGCGGDDGGTTADTQMLPACTGLPYDSCTDTVGGSDCMNGMMCRLFMSDGITICTPACSSTLPCPPDKDGNVPACNQMGRCKAQPNACTP